MAEGARGRTSDILLDVLAKELRVLRDEAGVHVEAAQVDVGEPHAVQRDLPARRRVEVHEKVDQRRLSAAALAHKCHGRAALDAQVDTVENLLVRSHLVHKLHILEDESATDFFLLEDNAGVQVHGGH